jgi:hypothetical protein
LRRFFVLVLALSIFGLTAKAMAEDLELVGPEQAVAQGEVVQILLRGATDGSRALGFWQGRPFEFFKIDDDHYGSLLGIDLKLAAGTYPLKVEVDSPGGNPLTRRTSIEVVKKDFGVQRLSLPANMVTLDSATLKRVKREGAKFSRLWYRQNPHRYWQGSFVRPVPGKRTTPFGLRRILNGEPRSSHSGVDLRAAEGELVRATNHGKVILVGDFYFHGKAVVIDHGWGIYSMYFHLSRVDVAEGDFVGKNAIIGLAGSTGRATGPHLHWGVRIGGARVDPFALLRVTSE